MKYIAFVFVFFTVCFLSCRHQKSSVPYSDSYYDVFYKGEENYKQFYIVDTIKIENPVIVWSKLHGGPFVMGKSKLDEYSDNLDFFKGPDIFIYWPDLYFFLDQDQIELIDYKNSGGCIENKREIVRENLWVSEFSGKPIFILGLSNANHYHRIRRSENYFKISLENPKYFYIKIAFPLCE